MMMRVVVGALLFRTTSRTCWLFKANRAAAKMGPIEDPIAKWRMTCRNSCRSLMVSSFEVSAGTPEMQSSSRGKLEYVDAVPEPEADGGAIRWPKRRKAARRRLGIASPFCRSRSGSGTFDRKDAYFCIFFADLLGVLKGLGSIGGLRLLHIFENRQNDARFWRVARDR